MASGDRKRDLDGDAGRGDGPEPSHHPAPDCEGPFSADDISPAERDSRAIRTPPAGAHGRGDPGYDPTWLGLLAGDGWRELRRRSDLDRPRRPVNAADASVGQRPQRPRTPQASPRAEATPVAARATRADELSTLQGAQGRLWLIMDRPDDPGSGSPPTALWWLVALVTAATVALALAGLVEWLR